MLNILTLNWDGKDKLEKLYPSLMRSLDGIDYQWFIKDNNSKDDSIKYINSFENNKVKILSYKDNRQNFSEGCNYLFNMAASNDNDLVMLLNNDIIFNDKSSIKNMINIMKDDKVGAVGCRLLYTDTDKLQHAGVVFDPTHHRLPSHYRANEKSDANAEKNREFQVVTGAILLTKAEYFKNIFDKNPSGIKGLDENLRWSFDDIDMCLSIKYNMNKKIVYCGNTNIFHEESASLKKNPTNKLFMNHNSNYLRSKWANRYSIDKDQYINDASFNLYNK